MWHTPRKVWRRLQPPLSLAHPELLQAFLAACVCCKVRGRDSNNHVSSPLISESNGCHWGKRAKGEQEVSNCGGWPWASPYKKESSLLPTAAGRMHHLPLAWRGRWGRQWMSHHAGSCLVKRAASSRSFDLDCRTRLLVDSSCFSQVQLLPLRHTSGSLKAHQLGIP